MHRTRKPDDRITSDTRKLDLRRETLRRLDSLSDDELRRAVAGRGTVTGLPSVAPTGDTGC